MRLAIGLLGCLAAGGAARADEVRPEDRASVEVTAGRETCYVGEPFEVRLRVTYDAVFFRDFAVSPFLRPLDVPLRIEAPWLRTWSGATAIATGAGVETAAGERVRIAVNDDVVEAIVIGRAPSAVASAGGPGGAKPAMTTIEIARTFVATGDGELVVPAPTLSFTWATVFADDLVNGRVPVERRDVVRNGEPRTLRVLPLPEAGRPGGFQGAIGRFAVLAGIDRRKVGVGEPFHLKLRITGTGNLATFPTPRLDDLDGFHVYGAIDDRRAVVRTIDYELAVVRDDVSAVPPIPFAYFDPSTESAAGYRVARTQTDLVSTCAGRRRRRPARGVRSRRASLVREPSFQWASGDAGRPRAGGDHAPGEAPRAHAGRARSRDRPRPIGIGGVSRADRAVRTSTWPPRSPRCSRRIWTARPAAVISSDLGARLLARNRAPSVAARAAAMMERLVGARYGGDGAESVAESARALVDELEDAVRPVQSTR